MPHIQIEAPAKLNLHLRVGGRRPDGFHEIESLFLALAWGDTLHIETVPQPLSCEIRMNWQFPPPLAASQTALSPEQNSITHAVSLFRNSTGYDEGLKITVEKRIPLGGGLGGGASNAAAMLLALNRLASPDGKGLVNDRVLAIMGESLGSDVPFFLHNAAAAWVSGRGEKIQPLKLPESVQNLSLVLVNPGFPSDTTEAYRLLDLYRGTYIPNNLSQRRGDAKDIEQFSSDSPSANRRFDASLRLGENSFEDNFLLKSPQNWLFFNDFLPVFQAESGESLAISEAKTVYKHIISCLKEQGADFVGLSGSGSTCFGVFLEQNKAESAKEFLLNHWSFVINTFCLRSR